MLYLVSAGMISLLFCIQVKFILFVEHFVLHGFTFYFSAIGSQQLLALPLKEICEAKQGRGKMIVLRDFLNKQFGIK